MNIAVKRILTVIVSLFLISYVIYQAYSALYDPIKTMRADSGTYEDLIKTEGFVLHNETLVKSAQDGVVDYVKGDGEAVEKGGEVADIYNSEKDASNQRKIQTLEGQIAQYQQEGSAATAATIDVDVLNSQIKKNFLSLVQASDGGDITNIAALKSNMLSLLNKKQLATGEITNFNAQIAKLQAKCDALKNETGGKTGTVGAPCAGYFVSSSDGLENSYSFNNALSITPNDIKALLSKKASSENGVIGKILSGYASYIVCDLGPDEAYKLHVGRTVEIRFPLSSQPQVSATVAAINKNDSGVAAVFKCETMSGALAVIRRQTVEIVPNAYTGIKVLDSFVHVIGGTKGVFVRVGNVVKFKKLNAIFSAAGYTVSAINTSDDSYLQIYDEVIENGDDLYDGKVIK